MKKNIVIAAALVLAGCAVPLTPEAERVKLVTPAQKEQCEVIKLVSSNKRLGWDKPGNAMRIALNETAAVGGNAFYLASSAMDWAEGGSVVGEALRCK